MSQPLRLVFAGTPEFAVPHFAACMRHGVEIVAVYTQPDRPAGRGRKLGASPVKHAALEAGLRIEQPESLRKPAERARLAAYAPDLVVVVAYGLILPRKVLDLPRLGCWNVHASLLPRWRGAAPIQRAILAGDAETGVCLMQMEAGLDTGPVLLQRSLQIASDETSGSLHDRLAVLGAHVLEEGLREVCAGRLPAPRPQAQDGLVYAHKLDKAEARLDWHEPAAALERKVRAFDPWPVAEAEVAGEMLRIWRAEAVPERAAVPGAAMPGNVAAVARDSVDVACGQGALRLFEVQRAGGKRMRVGDYLNARPQFRAGVTPAVR